MEYKLKTYNIKVSNNSNIDTQTEDSNGCIEIGTKHASNRSIMVLVFKK